MSRLQKLLVAVYPERWAESMEAESRSWMICCPSCGYAISVWDAGGVRWKAKGTPRTRMRCPQCGHVGWAQIRRSDKAGA